MLTAVAESSRLVGIVLLKVFHSALMPRSPSVRKPVLGA